MHYCTTIRPSKNSFAVCRALRANPDTASVAIVMLTAKGEERDIVNGLDAGANDYVTKPFSKEVLLARLRAVLRRDGVQTDARLVRDGLVLDDATHQVARDSAASRSRRSCCSPRSSSW